MPTVTAFEAKTRFGELLDRASRGEEIVITRHDKPVARLIPEGADSTADVARAVDEILQSRNALAAKRVPAISRADVKRAINEGRR